MTTAAIRLRQKLANASNSLVFAGEDGELWDVGLNEVKGDGSVHGWIARVVSWISHTERSIRDREPITIHADGRVEGGPEWFRKYAKELLERPDAPEES